MKIFYIIVSTIFLIVVGILLYNKLFYTNITVKFEDLEPFNEKMKVYYKGFQIGKSEEIFPDKEFVNTYLRLKISRKNLNFPENIKAELKNRGANPYINIVYPSSPSIKRLKNGTIIEGKYQKNLDSIINDTINGESAQNIIGNASNLIENANNTVTSLGKVFDEITGILQDIRPNINMAAKNLEKTTMHLSNVSDNLDNALGRTQTKNSVDNIEKITEDLNNITTQINEVSMPFVNSILCETNGITKGINCTLKKQFGLMRMFFGKPVSKCERCQEQ